MLGFTPAENLRGMQLQTLWGNPTEHQRYINELLAKGSISKYLIHATTKQGYQIAILVSAHIVYDKEKTPLRIDGVFLDLTQRITLEEELRQRVTELTTIHRTAERLTKLQTLETLARDILEILEETVKYDYGAIAFIEEETNKLVPFAFRTKNSADTTSSIDKAYLNKFHFYVGCGVTGWVASSGQSVRIDDVSNDERYIQVYDDVLSELCVPLRVGNKIFGIINLESTKRNAYTLTDQRLLETIAAQVAIAIQSSQLYEDLRISEERYRQISELISDYAYAFRVEEGTTLIREWVTDSFERITGYAPQELDEKGGWSSIIYPDDMPIALHRANRLLHGTEDVSEFRIVRKDGAIRWLRDHAKPVWSNVENRVVRIYGAAKDITEYKDAEKRILQAHQRYEHFFMNDLSADFICNPDGSLIACNPSFLKLFGFSSLGEALSQNITTLFVHPDEIHCILNKLMNGEQCEHREIQMKRRDGTTLYIIANIIGRYSTQHTLLEISGYLVDKTKQRMLEEGIFQQAKLESLGTLASGIAHDFNNILGIIIGHASFLERLQADSPLLKKHVEAITKASMRGAELVKQMLMFARKTEVHFEPLNLNDVVHEVLHLVRETFPKTIEVSLTLDTEIPLIEGDATQLHQVLLNLCVNARDAMPKGGVLRIATYRSTGSLIKEHSPKAHENEYVTLEVADNGCGMDEETMRRIFEPFFTTKEKGKGTGLGLSLVYGIIESHGGIITVESKVGQGSTFRCYFPTVLGRTQSVPRFTSPDTLRGGTETILIVEDELLLRSLLHDLLTNYGYRVHLAADGEEALDIYNRYTSIDLVISDYGLPKFTGEELYRRLKQRNQDIRFILASGFIEPLLKEQMQKLAL